MEARMIRCYAAGPYSGNEMGNTIDALAVGDRLDALGFNAFVPHNWHWWSLIHPRTYEEWMKKCLAEVERSDVLLRMAGASSGADREVEHAKAHGIPVVYSEAELLTWAEGRKASNG
jgi:hypothetical protein